MNKLIVSNWKMKPDSSSEAADLLEFINDNLDLLGEKVELSLVFCAPFVFLESVRTLLNQSHLRHEAFLGAQDISMADEGALTGEISGPMLSHLGVSYVIVGHSERRWKLGESPELINQKLKAVLRNGMTPIVCIGERSREGDFRQEINQQILETFRDLDQDQKSSCVIAYEPVWAISGQNQSQPATAQDAVEALKFIKESVGPEIQYLYGGSVTSSNVREFLETPDFSGVLIGGASVQKKEFAKILNIAAGLLKGN